MKSDNEKFCHECGSAIKAKAEICPKCGVRQPSTGPSSSGRDRIVAVLLAFLFGGIGAHRFYLGQTLSGVLYLLFFWTFIPSVLALIDGIVLLSMNDETFRSKYP